MTILALEFSSAVRGAALVQSGRVLGTASESGGRDTHAFALIEQVLTQASVEREAVECIAIGLGPGSYAGIRVSIALAQGWELARGVKLIGIRTAEVMAEQARDAGHRGRVHVMIDAQRAEFYHAAYRLDDVCAHELAPMRLTRLEGVRREAGEDPILVPEKIDLQSSDELARARISVTPPQAAVLGRLAIGRSDFQPGAALQPVYLRETNFVKAPPPRVIAFGAS